MKRIYRYVVGALSVLALGTTINANASSNKNKSNNPSTNSTPNLMIPNLEAGQKTISGTATKGVTITVKANDKKQTRLAVTTASNKTGKYTLKLAKGVSANAKLYVYAQAKGAHNYFYRIINVKPQGFFKKTTTAKTHSSTATSNITRKDLTGNWQSKKDKQNQISFDVKAGFSWLNSNGKKQHTIVKDASYQIIRHNANFWQINYRQAGNNKQQTLYVHMDSNTQFHLTNAKDTVTSTSNDNVYTLTK